MPQVEKVMDYWKNLSNQLELEQRESPLVPVGSWDKEYLGEFSKKNSRHCSNCGDTNGDIIVRPTGRIVYQCDTCGHRTKL